MTALSVSDRARAIATFRFVEVKLMETVAAWTPTTPEMEVKVVFGRHIFDFAQHADQLGKRTYELRLPEQSSRKPEAAYLDLLEALARLRSTAERLGTLYGAVLPELNRRYADYLKATDPILDQPSVIIIERIQRDLERMRGEVEALHGAAGIPRFSPDAHLNADRSIRQIVAP